MSSTSDPIITTYKKEEGDKELFPGGLLIKPDGRVVRSSVRLPPSPNFVNGIACRDAVIDPETGIWARIYVPETVAPEESKKLPVVVYFHGGGFCLGDAGAESTTYHCTRTCKDANVVVVAPSYRLAPEHRLPTAYNDGITTLLWLQKQCKLQASSAEGGESWLNNHADFSQVFLMGQSAGGNLVHYLTVLKPPSELGPLSIKGIIPVVPFFSGESQSESEKLYSNDEVLPTDKHRTFWRCCLPEGSNRDHPYCNPLTPDAPNLAEVHLPRMLVLVGGKDPLYTRQIEYVNTLKKAGKDVKLVEVPEGLHTFRANPALEAENARVDKAIFEFIHLSD